MPIGRKNVQRLNKCTGRPRQAGGPMVDCDWNVATPPVFVICCLAMVLRSDRTGIWSHTHCRGRGGGGVREAMDMIGRYEYDIASSVNSTNSTELCFLFENKSVCVKISYLGVGQKLRIE